MNLCQGSGDRYLFVGAILGGVSRLWEIFFSYGLLIVYICTWREKKRRTFNVFMVPFQKVLNIRYEWSGFCDCMNSDDVSIRTAASRCLYPDS